MPSDIQNIPTCMTNFRNQVSGWILFLAVHVCQVTLPIFIIYDYL